MFLSNVIITVGSVTYAIKLKKILAREGIQSTLIKRESIDGRLGCSHGIELCEKDLYSAVVIMRENGISYSVEQK
jgi:hypothetical protein